MLKPIFLKLYILAIAIGCTAVIVTSCDDDEDHIPVSDVTIDDSTLLLNEGQKQPLKVIFTPENASNKSVTWKSDNETIATVSASGEVEAESVGTTTITVTTQDGNKTATCEVTVQKPIVSVTGVSLNKTEFPIWVGEKITLTAIIAPENATIKTVKWHSDDESIATVSELGEVEGKSIGTTTITVTTLDGEKTATCNVIVDAGEFTVTFETNGASKIDDVIVNKGETVAKPENPIMEGGPGEGLYLGVIDPDAGSFTFEGWYIDEALTNEYDFSTPVTDNLTLYAKWSGDVPEPINVESAVGNNILDKSYNYLNTVSLTEPTEYTLILTGNITNPNFSTGNFKNSNVSLLLIGKGEERVINKTVAGNMFTFDAGTLILGNNIKITASGVGNYYIVYLMGTSRGIMRDGAKISDITGAAGNAGAVNLNSGDATFTMEGGEICNNVVERAAGGIIGAAVSVTWGKFYMQGGIISGNKAITGFTTHNISGGVYINNYTEFHKTGGVIKDNTAVITATDPGTAKTGQQVFYSAENGKPSTWRKVDDNLSEIDNLTTGNLSNPLWQVVD